VEGEGRALDRLGLGELREPVCGPCHLPGAGDKDPDELPHRVGQGGEPIQSGERGGVLHPVHHVVQYLGQAGEVFAVDGRDERLVDRHVESSADGVRLGLDRLEPRCDRLDPVEPGGSLQFREDRSPGVDLGRQLPEEGEEMVLPRDEEPDKPVEYHGRLRDPRVDSAD
jgi:hypothetical protein